MKKYIGELGLTLTAIIWGSGFAASAMALEFYTPYQILAGRFLIGVVLLSVCFHKSVKSMKKRTMMKGLLLGTILYIAFALQTVGLQYTTPSKNAFLTAVNVVIVPFIGFLFYKRKIDLFELMGAILSIIGIALLSLQLNGEMNIGDLLTLLCAVAFACHIFYTARFVREEDPIALTLMQMLTAACIGFMVTGLKGEMHFAMHQEALMPLVYLGIFSTTIAYVLQTAAQKFITETKAAIILSTEALWGTFFSVLLLSEVLTWRMTIGAIIIFFAIIIAETKLKWKPFQRPLVKP
ncbi:MAG TPA: DMT family transporter [Pseudogracilibacillus sp.]|nr:DMT family transporter [Pseudogracilibacillus sp.]